MDDFGLPTPPAPIPETPMIAPPKKKFPVKVVAGVLMVFLLAGGVFVTDRITLQRQIIESQGKTAKKAPKDVDKKEDCGGASNGGWQVWRGGECKITGISGSTDDGGPNKDTEDPNIKIATGSENCTRTGNDWCDGMLDYTGASIPGFCAAPTSGACRDKALKDGYILCSGTSSGTGCNDTSGTIYFCTPSLYAQKGNVCHGEFGAQTLNRIPNCFCGTIQIDRADGSHTSLEGSCGCDQEAAAAEVLPGPSPSPGASPSPSPSPSPSISCTDLTSNKVAPAMGDTVNFTCKANFSAAAPVAIFRHNVNGGSFVESATLPLNAAGEAGLSLPIDQTGDWEVQCRVCTDSTATICTDWGQAN